MSAALRKIDPKPGALIAVVGISGLGHLAIQYAKVAGYKVTAVTSTVDQHNLAHRLGADQVVIDGTNCAMPGAPTC